MAHLKPSGEKAALCLEDLRVGQRFLSGTHRIDEEQIRAFAEQFDPQPFHLDAEAAEETLFEGLVASGWHTAAVTMRLLVGGGLPIAGGIVGAGGEVAWPRPVRPGAVLHVESEILELRPSRPRPDRGVVTVRSETRGQGLRITASPEYRRRGEFLRENWGRGPPRSASWRCSKGRGGPGVRIASDGGATPDSRPHGGA
jgi:acyl dehydratase